MFLAEKLLLEDMLLLTDDHRFIIDDHRIANYEFIADNQLIKDDGIEDQAKDSINGIIYNNDNNKQIKKNLKDYIISFVFPKYRFRLATFKLSKYDRDFTLVQQG